MRLLVVEDEEELARALVKGLSLLGHAVDQASDGDLALEALEIEDYDLLLLDLNLPGVGGIDVIRRARKSHPDLLILVLTARASEEDRVRGLDLGADDYVTKPFYMRELSARIRSLLRRDRRTRPPILRCQDLELDPATHTVRKLNTELDLGRKEFALLHYLMHHAGEVVSQEELLDHVWDANANPFTNVVPVHINSLRRALGDSARSPCYIRTVVGEGYQLLGGRETPLEPAAGRNCEQS